MSKKRTADTSYRPSKVASIKKSTIARVTREGNDLRKREKKATGRAADSFVNYAANFGIGTNNITSSSGYGFNPITRVRTMLDWIYRGSWIGGVAVDLVADDMTRAGIEIQSTAKPEDEQAIQQELVRLRVWSSINDVIKWSRLYGGAIAVILIDGQDPKTPLRLETVGKDKFKGLMVLDRWMVDPDLQHLVSDLGPSIGLPEYYRIVTDSPAMRNQTIHYSRCIRLEGVRLPYWQRVMENMWGLSVYERLYDRMIAFDSATTGAAQLVYKSFIRTYKLDGLREAQTAGGDSMVGIAQNVELMRKYQGIEGVTIIDAKDEFEANSTTSFAGLSDALVQFAQQLGGALQIPMTRLFGQAPAGLNATGESDIRTYYDGILQAQESDLREGLNKILRVAARSKGIVLDESFNFTFVPLWQLSEEEKSNVSDKDTRMILEAEASGLISERVALQELRNGSKRTGRWTNITDEMIAAASDVAGPPDPEMEEGLTTGGSEHPIKAGEKLAEEREPGSKAAAALRNGKGLAAAMDDPDDDGSGGGAKPRPKMPSRDHDVVQAIMAQALANAGVQAAIKSPDIDASHDVRCVAVSSEVGGKTYVSALLPRRVAIKDRIVVPGVFLNVHEQVERFCMSELAMPYQQAHVVATRAEKWAVELAGVAWMDWEHWIDGEANKIEHGPGANPPPDPHVDIDRAVGHHSKPKARDSLTDDGIREIVAQYVTVPNAKEAVALALIGFISHVAQMQGPEVDLSVSHTVHHIEELAHISHGRARELVRRVLAPKRAAGKAATDADTPYSMVAGLQVVIEYPRGTYRSGENADGSRWENVTVADYGYVRRVGSAEGPEEYLDCFVGPNHSSRDVWVIDGQWPDGTFDEHKVVLGASNSREAVGYFRGTYGDTRRIMAVTHLSVDSLQFKNWLATGDKTVPMRQQKAA